VRSLRFDDMVPIDRSRLSGLLEAERAEHVRRHPASQALYGAGSHLVGQVPMTWMNKWSGGFPLYLDRARGNRIETVDGHELVDFALGDTGAMAGHSPAPTVEAIARRASQLGGLTTMLPTEDAEWVAEELCARFGLDRWSFTLSATDANRWALRLARLVTGRPKVLVFSYCYHGSVDEAFVVLDGQGRPRSRPGNVAPAVDPSQTTRVVEFNDVEALARELGHGDVAVVLMEPALTNIGIVLPEPGFLAEVRRCCDETGTLLMIDETHTISMGWGGATTAWGLRPDLFSIGKALGGGVPCGAYGMTAEVAARLDEALADGADIVDVGGVGGTLAGNALSLAAMRATLGEVLTPAAFEHMVARCDEFVTGVESVLARTEVPWSVVQLGARAEYRFCEPAPRSGGASAAAADDQLDEYLHLFLSNRGVLITPFHNMALMCPETSSADVALHTELFGEAVGALVA
jgi:glutamate-1-semialdehyde 2,1-aminomutase